MTKLRVKNTQAVRRAGGSRQDPIDTLKCTGIQGLDPHVQVPRQVIGHWAERAFAGTLPARTHKWWEAVRPHEVLGRSHRSVKGPCGALIRHAADIGWEVLGPHTLLDHHGESIDLTTTAPDAVRMRVAAAAEDTVWARTPNTRRDARGLTGAPDWIPVQKALDTIRKEDGVDLAAFAENLVKGGFWGEARLDRANQDIEPLCPRCGQGPAEAYHCIWQCPATAHLRDGRAAGIPQACQAHRDGLLPAHVALWTRGLVQAADMIGAPRGGNRSPGPGSGAPAGGGVQTQTVDGRVGH